MCEPDRGVPLGGVLAVAGIVAGGLVALRVAVAAVPVLVALSQVVLAACAVGTWLTWRLFRYGSVGEVFRRHRRVKVARVRQAALPAGTRLALEAAKPPVHAVITSVEERTGWEHTDLFHGCPGGQHCATP